MSPSPRSKHRRLKRLTGSPERLLFVGALTLVVLCALGGGGSRPDILSLVYVRIAAAWLLAFAVVAHWPYVKKSPSRPLVLLLAALALWMSIQLLPLPPSLWQAIPGHERYAAEAAILEDATPWRPISLVPRLTWNSLVSLLAPFALLLALIGQPARRVDTMLAFWLIVCLASALLGILQAVGPDNSPLYFYKSSSRGYAVGFFANRNHQAAMLAAALPMLAIWVSDRTGRPSPMIRAWIGLLAAVLLIVGVLSTGSRAGLLLTGIGLVMALALIILRLGRAMRDRRLLLMLGAFACALVLLIAVVVLSGRATGFVRAADPNAYVSELRLVHAPLIWSMTRQFFPFGTGFGSFDPIFRGFEPDATLRPTFYNHAHNDFLEWVLTGGLPALIIALAFAAWWFRRSWTAWQARSSIGLAGSAIIFLLLAASVTDYPLRTTLGAVLLVTACWWLAVADGRSGRVGGAAMNALPPPGSRLSGGGSRRAAAIDRAIE